MNDSVPARFLDLPEAWRGGVIVCGSCSKKMRGGFGARQKHSLAKMLRATMPQGATLPRVIEVSCLGICPINAVTLIDPATPEMWRIIPRGTDVAALAASLGRHHRPLTSM